MEKIYSPKTIEKNIQKYWDTQKTFKVYENKKKKKYYCLSMLPYPSGKLHMGHVRNYTIGDVLARYHRMQGKNVLHPIGWDAFGLPAETAAIKNNIVPMQWTYQNIQYMKKQLQKLGLSYDWDREITTCEPNYYKWEQWLFNKLYYKKLVYKKKSIVNWCPKDKTVLANEQVINNQCWRCQSKIITKLQSQWFLKITKYSERLLNDLKTLNQWPKKVKTMQKNWIGLSKGFEIIFDILNTNQKITIYITKLHLLIDIQFIAISPLHPLSKVELQKKELKELINNTYNTQNNNIHYSTFKYLGKKISKYAIHPITKKKIPIWITNYTELEYKTDTRGSLPNHNMYDFYFSKKYNITIKKVNTLHQFQIFHNIKKENMDETIFKYLNIEKKIKKKNNFLLKDWGISRQRYWGTPIPIIYINNKMMTIPNNQLPLISPKINTNHEFQKIGKIYKKWSHVYINKIPARRETETFDTFIESSWYYIRYTCPSFTGMLDKKLVNYWLPVDQYIGGIEHATMHLIYFRFFHKILYDLNLVKNREPVVNLLCQGMVLSDAFYYINQKGEKKWISSKKIKITKNKNGNIKNICSKKKEKIIHAGMMKMSKSKNNGIDPEEMIEKYSADTIRLFMMFSAPITADIEWNESGVKGMYRFLQKIWKLVYDYIHNVHEKIKKNNISQVKEINNILNKTVIKVSHDIENRKSFNTAISEIIKFTNYIQKIFLIQNHEKKFIKYILNTIIKILYPFTPHISFYLWKKINHNHNIDIENWPKYNVNLINEENIPLIVQINGKKKEIMLIQKNTTKTKIIEYLYNTSKISNFLKKNNIKNIIYIKNKLINLVI
ncbi:leucine--tRNA ligase [Buchnera aphidicola]|uniref:leucine--tRNA ligase n=1 Tax=Buchnera aphidicola TaxID=9 RepID=UPI0034638D72